MTTGGTQRGDPPDRVRGVKGQGEEAQIAETLCEPIDERHRADPQLLQRVFDVRNAEGWIYGGQIGTMLIFQRPMSEAWYGFGAGLTRGASTDEMRTQAAVDS